MPQMNLKKISQENFLGTHGKRSADEPMEMSDEEALAYLVAKLSTPTGFFLKPGKRGNDLIKRRYIPGGMFGNKKFAKKNVFEIKKFYNSIYREKGHF